MQTNLVLLNDFHEWISDVIRKGLFIEYYKMIQSNKNIDNCLHNIPFSVVD